MAHIHRLIVAILVVFSAFDASAVITPSQKWHAYRYSRAENPEGWRSTKLEAVQSWCAWVISGWSTKDPYPISCIPNPANPEGGYSMMLRSRDYGSEIGPSIDGLFLHSAVGCPSGSTSNAQGTCDCTAPLVEKNGACVAPESKPDSLCGEMAGKPLGLPVTADYGSKTPGALGRMIGKPSTTCFPGGCSVSGTVSGCWSAKGVAGCNLTDAKFTGDKCDDKAPPGGCPSGSSPSQYAAGVCIPDENKCPAGSSPSKYASGVCIPDENPCPAGQAPSKYAAGVCVPKDDPNADGNGETGNNSKCPPGRVESRYAAGVCIPADTTVGDGSGGGGGTTCKDGKCTTTNPDGSTDEKPEKEFCKENPDAPQCKKSNWGGSCGSFTCDGDAIQCAIAREQHQRNCKLFDEKTSHPAYQAAVDGTDEQSADKLKAKAEQISVGTNFDQAGFGWAKGCPADPEIPLGFVQQSFTIPFSRICGPLEALSLAGVGITLLGCLVWVIGGKKA